MKRDPDLIRSILILAEVQPAGEWTSDLSSLNVDNETAVEHVRLARDAGLLEANITNLPGKSFALIIRLTPAGHDFLAQARQPELWNQAKDTVAKAGVGGTVEVFKTVLSQLAAAAIKAQLGI
jgi:hypothetical protein